MICYPFIVTDISHNLLNLNGVIQIIIKKVIYSNTTLFIMKKSRSPITVLDLYNPVCFSFLNNHFAASRRTMNHRLGNILIHSVFINALLQFWPVRHGEPLKKYGLANAARLFESCVVKRTPYKIFVMFSVEAWNRYKLAVGKCDV